MKEKGKIRIESRKDSNRGNSDTGTWTQKSTVSFPCWD